MFYCRPCQCLFGDYFFIWMIRVSLRYQLITEFAFSTCHLFYWRLCTCLNSVQPLNTTSTTCYCFLAKNKTQQQQHDNMFMHMTIFTLTLFKSCWFHVFSSHYILYTCVAFSSNYNEHWTQMETGVVLGSSDSFHMHRSQTC